MALESDGPCRLAAEGRQSARTSMGLQSSLGFTRNRAFGFNSNGQAADRSTEARLLEPHSPRSFHPLSRGGVAQPLRGCPGGIQRQERFDLLQDVGALRVAGGEAAVEGPQAAEQRLLRGALREGQGTERYGLGSTLKWLIQSDRWCIRCTMVYGYMVSV